MIVTALAMITASVNAGSHGFGGSRGGFHLSSGRGFGFHGPVHVGSHLRSNGSYVRSYNRALPGTKFTFPKATAVFPKATAISKSVFYPKALPAFKAPVMSLSPYIQRDADGRIHRSSAVRHEFMRETGHPNGWPGHVIDHIQALKHGGADAIWNMQWQSIADAKAKDKVE
jgi:hypothetical protein